LRSLFEVAISLTMPVCREDQIKDEVADLFDFMSSFYGLLGLTFKLRLSTRPDKFMGEIATWDRAEARLKEALDEFAAKNPGVTWDLNPGDGAFYGPKIDIAVMDCLNVRSPLFLFGVWNWSH
jgi:threonyl-tRNA synthetase